MRVLISLLVFVGAGYAAPLPMNFTISVDFINSVCAKLEDAKYKQYMAQWMVQPVCSMPQDAKQQMADFANSFHACKYPVPHTRDAFLDLLKQNAPLVAQVFEKVLADGISKWQKLNEGANKFVAKWEGNAYKNLDCDRLTMFVNIISEGKEFIADANALTPEDWASLKEQFPEFVDAWNNMPNVKAAKAMLEKLPDDFDFRGDPDTMRKLFEMMLADFMPKDAGAEN